MLICGACGRESQTLMLCRQDFVCPLCYRKATEGPCDRCGEAGSLAASENQTELICESCKLNERMEGFYG